MATKFDDSLTALQETPTLPQLGMKSDTDFCNPAVSKIKQFSSIKADPSLVSDVQLSAKTVHRSQWVFRALK